MCDRLDACIFHCDQDSSRTRGALRRWRKEHRRGGGHFKAFSINPILTTNLLRSLLFPPTFFMLLRLKYCVVTQQRRQRNVPNSQSVENQRNIFLRSYNSSN